MPQMGQLAQQGAIPSQMYADFAMDYLKTQGVDTERYAMQPGSMLTPNTQMQNPTEGYVDRRS